MCSREAGGLGSLFEDGGANLATPLFIFETISSFPSQEAPLNACHAARPESQALTVGPERL